MSIEANVQEWIPDGSEVGVGDDTDELLSLTVDAVEPAELSLVPDLVDYAMPSAMATRDQHKDYLDKVGQLPVLTREQVIELSKRMEAGVLAEERRNLHGDELNADEIEELEWLINDGRRAKTHMILSNIKLVAKYARPFTGQGMPYMDLVQEGTLGLTRAVEGFDHTKGYMFSTYAPRFIKQAIFRAWADQSRTIRIPINVTEIMRNVYETRQQLLPKLGREPTDEEVAEKLDMTVESIVELKNYNQWTLSLNYLLGDDDELECGDLFVDEDAVSPEDAGAEAADNAQLNKHMAEILNERQAGVLRLYFGEELTLDAIGALYGVTGPRIRQLRVRAMEKLEARGEILKAYLD